MHLKTLLSTLLLPALFISGSKAIAQNVSVTVFEKGKAVAGATVCIGSKQEKSLFGNYETDSSGKVTIHNLPNGKMLATVNSKAAGAELLFMQNVSQQDLFLRIPDEPNSLRCPNDE